MICLKCHRSHVADMTCLYRHWLHVELVVTEVDLVLDAVTLLQQHRLSCSATQASDNVHLHRKKMPPCTCKLMHIKNTNWQHFSADQCAILKLLHENSLQFTKWGKNLQTSLSTCTQTCIRPCIILHVHVYVHTCTANNY